MMRDKISVLKKAAEALLGEVGRDRDVEMGDA